jgi:glycerophosphoryl diester phosphodiesterase
MRHTAPAISAHRGGGEYALEGTFEAYRSALEAGAEYLEFDVRRTVDATLVSCHRPRPAWGRAVAAVSYDRLCRLAGFRVPRMTEVLPMLTGRAVAHLDLKQADCAEEIVALAAGILGPHGILPTTEDAAQAAALKRRFPDVPVGLTIGGDVGQLARFAVRRMREPGLSRIDQVQAAGADWAVVYRQLARTGVLAECRRRRIRTAVWTVNSDRALAHWLASPDVDLLVTGRPARAIALRRRTAAGGPPGSSVTPGPR